MANQISQLDLGLGLDISYIDKIKHQSLGKDDVLKIADKILTRDE